MSNFTGAIVGTGLALMATQAVEPMLPVVATMDLQNVTRSAGVVSGDVTGRKIKQCTVVGGSFLGWQKLHGVWSEVPFAFVDDPSPNSTRPNSWARQSFDIWQWSGVSDEAQAVKLSLLHNCDGRLQITQISFKDIDL